jgi:ABC-type Na+ efflux pump permease subunit
MNKTGIVFAKELREILANKTLLASLASLPVVMVAVSLFVLFSYVAGANDPAIEAIARYYVPNLKHGTGALTLIEVTVRNAVGLFLVMPIFLPVIIASHAVAGEKERRTLEPLLATPLTAAELVLGKSLSAVVPAVGITWIAFAGFALGADLLTYPLLHRVMLPDRTFLFAVLILSPLLSFLGNCISVLISARVNDPRLAQSLAGLLVMPFFAVVALQFAGLLALGPVVYVSLAAGALIADVLMLRLAVALFDRDRLLTRWG